MLHSWFHSESKLRATYTTDRAQRWWNIGQWRLDLSQRNGKNMAILNDVCVCVFMFKFISTIINKIQNEALRQYQYEVTWRSPCWKPSLCYIDPHFIRISEIHTCITYTRTDVNNTDLEWKKEYRREGERDPVNININFTIILKLSYLEYWWTIDNYRCVSSIFIQ